MYWVWYDHFTLPWCVAFHRTDTTIQYTATHHGRVKWSHHTCNIGFLVDIWNYRRYKMDAWGWYKTIIKLIKSRRMRWPGHIACIEGNRNAYWVLVGKPEEERPLWRPRWDYNIVKPRFILFVGGLKKKWWIWENDRWGSLYKINKNYQMCLYVFTKSKNVLK
jgi:hypothetical protein